MSTDITLVCVEESEKSVLANLLQLYRHDLSAFRPYAISEHGSFTYRFLDHYWTEPGRHAFFIRYDGRLAGFAMVRQTSPSAHEIAEFFVLRRHRGTGVGEAAAHDVLRRFPGSWSVFHDDANLSAGGFWARIVTAASGGQYQQNAVVTSAGYVGQEYRFEVP